LLRLEREEDFLPLATIEEAAFNGPQTTLFFGESASHDHPSQQLAIPASSKTDLPLSIAKPVYPPGKSSV